MAPRASVFTPVLAALLAASAATSLRVARAEEPADGTVVLRIAGPDDPALRDSIRELLARLHLALQTEGASPEADAGSSNSKSLVARVDVDLSSPGDAVLLVTNGNREIRFRRTIPREASVAIVREEIAHAVQSAVESEILAARERASSAPATPPAPAAPPPPSPPPPAANSPSAPLPSPTNESAKEEPASLARRLPFGLELTTLAGAGPIADGSGPVARVGLGGVVSLRAPLHPSLGISGLYAAPFDNDSVEVTTHTSLVSGRALAGLELFRGRWLAAGFGIGGGFDTMTVNPRSPNLPYSVLNGTTMRTDPILSAMATAHVALFPGVVFLVSAGVDVDLDSRHYVFAQGSTETDVLDPWRVRPMLLAGFGFTALGDGHFGGASGGVH
jgi:hypothetical protein